MSRLDLSGPELALVLQTNGGTAAVAELGRAGGASWVTRGRAAAFRVDVDGAPVRPRWELVRWESGPGWHQCVVESSTPEGLHIYHHTRRYDGEPIFEQWQVVRNASVDATLELTRLDSVVVDLDAVGAEARWFSSAWGAEFEPEQRRLDGAPLLLESRAGRSSNGIHPWLTLHRRDGDVLAVSPAWSGNWAIRVEPLEDGGQRLSAGLSDWAFARRLAPGAEIETPRVALAAAAGLDAVAVAFGRVGRAHWYPARPSWDRAPVEWNHWWPYEDREIDEATFLANVERAAVLGVEVCTLDAGWFGADDAGSDWVAQRGDWDTVNARRFPNGLRPLADRVHARGMRFGLWVEIEAVGPESRLGRRLGGCLATRGGEPLGYLCFGCVEAGRFALKTLERLIVELGCDWLKLDFNLDPGAGCDRVDHGHDAGNGLFEHYRGLYALLDELRARHPEVVLEACSSGGLRIDLGLARHTHVTFLSDPDWPEHALQVLWGATTMLAPSACLHWSWSQWRGEHPRQTFDPADPELTERALRTYLRIAMLTGFGVSWRLPELPAPVAALLREEIALYREHVARFVVDGDLHRLTGQTLRAGRGERRPAFQLSLPGSDEHLVLAFRLEDGEPAGRVRLTGLDPGRSYALRDLAAGAGGAARAVPGATLIGAGLDLSHLEPSDNAVLWLS